MVLTGKRGAWEKMGFGILNYKFCSLVLEGRRELGSSAGGRGEGVACGEIIIERGEEGGGAVEG